MVEGRIYKPVIQADRCRTCNICIRGCPAELISEYREEEKSLRGSLYRGKMKERSLKEKVSLPACQGACPIGQDTRGYVALIAKKRMKEALELIREVNPLPAVCGFICHHPCEEACLREGVDDPVPIRLLKRFVVEYERKGRRLRKGSRKKRREKVLVVGSGPAGLAAANDLSLLGFGITIVEALPVLGGMLAVGIPEFRLPRDILQMEIDGIKALGVEMKAGHRFCFEGDGKRFQKLGFQAVFLSTGAHLSLRLNIPGEKLHGVFPGVQFLKEVSVGKKVRIGRKVAVIGGGNVAIDAARSAIRLGAESVELYYRRSRREMPAIPEDVEEAVRERVRFHFLVSPIKILGRGEEVVGMECIRMELGESDETGRRRPVPVEGSNFKGEADSVISAIGQGMDRKALKEFETYQDGRIRVDPETGATSREGVFAGGDMVTGPGWAIDAIAAGKKGAASIHQYLS
ncbi:MAG: FAD-dependent oxidoreductase [Thermodesulfobacteriota bacterium]|jgi:NADPH-dependent glutamate synthase beta subunit-like oxidoreductase